MVAILQGGPDIEQPKLSDGYFLPYQQEYILSQHNIGLIEKSVRIGWTYADAFRNVRLRLMRPNRDYLFGTKDWPTALEYMRTCHQFVELYNRVRSVVSSGEMTVKVPGVDEYGNKQKFEEEIKIGYIKFDNGSRILAFSSNPAAMQAYGGDVGLDEYAKHRNQHALYATAQGRVTWGFDMNIWSAHWGDDNMFNDFAQEAREGAGPWDYHRRITMESAIEGGLVEKINEVSGKDQTREAFLADCKKRARTDDIYEQEYNCNPKGGTATIVSWAAMVKCKQTYAIERVHFEESEMLKSFGEYFKHKEAQRHEAIRNYLAGAFPNLLAKTRRRTLGFDVAASGRGDLASIYIDDEEGDDAQRLCALFTCRTEDWDFIKTVLGFYFDRLPALRGAGDETGLGRQICWETAKAYAGRFEGVNFASEKHDMGFELMSQLSETRRILPDDNGNKDIAQDYYAMKKEYKGKRWHFSEGKNSLNPNSHCDIAWAGALSLRVRQLNVSSGECILI